MPFSRFIRIFFAVLMSMKLMFTLQMFLWILRCGLFVFDKLNMISIYFVVVSIYKGFYLQLVYKGHFYRGEKSKGL